MSILEGYVEGMINLDGGDGGTSDYADLNNKPSINNVELVGNKTTGDLNISYNDLQNKPTIRNMPDSSEADVGDVLTHTISGDGWYPPAKELPTYTSEDEKYLKVVDGDLEWAEVSGGEVEYSTTEKVIGTWIDNKPIYQKTIVATSPINVLTSVTALGTYFNTELADVENFINAFCIRLAANSTAISCPLLVWKDGTAIKVYGISQCNNMTHFTFQYTKTTD